VTVVVLDIAEQTPDDVRTAAVDVVPPPSSPALTAPAPAASAGPVTAEPLTGSPARAEKPSGETGTTGETGAKNDAGNTATSAAAATAGNPGAPDSGSASDGKVADKAADGKEPETSTDPHLGEHLSAEVLRDELSRRPHELVGAAVAAAESGSIPSIAGRTVARRAATVLTHKSEQAREDADDFKAAGRPRRWLTVSIAAAVVALLAMGLWIGYAWTQTRYYIGEHDQHVAIFNGVSQQLGPIQLSTLEAVTDIKMSDLPEFSQQRVRQTVPARDLYDAQRIVKNLERTGTTSPADECLTPSPATPGATATSSASAIPGAKASPGATAPPGTAQPSPTPTTNCEGAK
jgi:protein phosphatase